MRVQAHADTFTQVLVVKSATAAAHPDLDRIEFRTSVTGGQLQTSPDGGVEVFDSAGGLVLAGPQPTLWDSTSRLLPEAPGAGTDVSNLSGPNTTDQVAPMPAKLVAGTLTVTPDQELLTGADTTYPVLIDPAISATRLHWAMVNQAFKTTSYWKWSSADEGMGYNNVSGNNLKRLFWAFDTTAIRGKQILSSTFKAYETFSYSCTASRVDLYVTNTVNSATTWDTQPAWPVYVSNRTVAVGRDGCTPGGAWIEFDAKVAAQRASDNNYSNITLGLRANNETTNTGWKRFRNDAVLSVTYNTPPSAPASVKLLVPDKPCATGTARPVINTRDMTLTAVGNDADAGDYLYGQFQYYYNGTVQPTLTTAQKVRGSRFDQPLARASDGVFKWHVRFSDTHFWGPWSGYCEFEVDGTAPTAAPTVSSTVYKEEQIGGGVGVAGSFTFGANGVTDVASYTWGLNVDTPTTTVKAATVGGTASVTITPSKVGPNWLVVRSVDRAGNVGPVKRYVFRVAGAGASMVWRLDEGTGTTINPSVGIVGGTTFGGATWTGGRFADAAPADKALSFDGADDYARSSITGPLRTDSSFSVTAWVRPADLTKSLPAVVQDGSAVSGFWVGYDHTAGAFTFAMPDTDSTTSAVRTAVAFDPVYEGEWTHVAATYDRATGLMRLYVNGQLSGETQRVGVWQATGYLRLGRAVKPGTGVAWGKGALDEIRTYPAVLSDTEVYQSATESR